MYLVFINIYQAYNELYTRRECFLTGFIGCVDKCTIFLKIPEISVSDIFRTQISDCSIKCHEIDKHFFFCFLCASLVNMGIIYAEKKSQNVSKHDLIDVFCRHARVFSLINHWCITCLLYLSQRNSVTKKNPFFD